MVSLVGPVSEQTENVSKVIDEMEAFRTLAKNFIEIANAPIFGVGPSLKVTEWNPKMAAMLCTTKQEAMGKHFVKTFVNPDQQTDFLEIIQRSILDGLTTSNYELQLVSASGMEHTVLLNVDPCLDSKNTIVGCVGVGHDVTRMANEKAWSWSAALGFDNSGLLYALYGVELETHLEEHQRDKMLQFTTDIESRAKLLISNGDCFSFEISWTEAFERDRWFAVHGVKDNGIVVGGLQEIQFRTVEAEATNKWRQLANAGFDLSLRVDITNGVIVDCCGSLLSTIKTPQDSLFAQIIGPDEMQPFEDKCASGVETWSTNLPISIIVEGRRQTVATHCVFICDNLFTQKCEVYVKLMHPCDLPQSGMAGVSSEHLAQYSIEPKPMMKFAIQSDEVGSGSTRGFAGTESSSLSAGALMTHNSATGVLTDEVVHKVWSDPSWISQCHDTLDSWSGDDHWGPRELQSNLESKGSWGNQKCVQLQLKPPSNLPPANKCLARGSRFKEHMQKVPLQGRFGASPPMGQAPHPQLIPLPRAWPLPTLSSEEGAPPPPTPSVLLAERRPQIAPPPSPVGVTPVSRPGQSKHYPAPLKVGLQKEAGVGLEFAVVPATGVKSASAIEDSTSTSLMLKNIPNDYTREMVLELLHTEGFALSYNFVFLPWDFRRQAALGYVFVNMVDHHTAIRAKDHFEGFVSWKVLGSQKVCEVCWTEPAQDLEALIERFRNAPVMHENVPEKYKPLLYKNGERVNFPLSTKPIKPPLKKKYGAEGQG